MFVYSGYRRQCVCVCVYVHVIRIPVYVPVSFWCRRPCVNSDVRCEWAHVVTIPVGTARRGRRRGKRLGHDTSPAATGLVGRGMVGRGMVGRESGSAVRGLCAITTTAHVTRRTALPRPFRTRFAYGWRTPAAAVAAAGRRCRCVHATDDDDDDDSPVRCRGKGEGDAAWRYRNAAVDFRRRRRRRPTRSVSAAPRRVRLLSNRPSDASVVRNATVFIANVRWGAKSGKRSPYTRAGGRHVVRTVAVHNIYTYVRHTHTRGRCKKIY